MTLEIIKVDSNIIGIEPSQAVTIVPVAPLRDEAVQVTYKTPGFTRNERLLNWAGESGINTAAATTKLTNQQLPVF